MSTQPEKICASCGRPFAYRKKWARCWDQVRYCSARCRSRRTSALDAQLETAILELLEDRNGTICPSEAARRVRPEAWRAEMERTRAAARRLAAIERIEILQRGRRVSELNVKGPIRLGRGRRYSREIAPHSRR